MYYSSKEIEFIGRRSVMEILRWMDDNININNIDDYPTYYAIFMQLVAEVLYY